MAKVSYVPYSQAYVDLFAFCHITLNTADYGGVQGWDAEAFAEAALAAQDYLNDNWDDDQAELYESYFDMLNNYDVNYWSTESYIPG